MAAHARLKNEFTEDEKYHNFMTLLISAFRLPRTKFMFDRRLRNEPNISVHTIGMTPSLYSDVLSLANSHGFVL